MTRYFCSGMGQTVYLAECEWVLPDSESEKYPWHVMLEWALVQSQRDLMRRES